MNSGYRALAFAALLAAAPIHAAPPLELMVENAAAPWSGSDGTGYANDLVTAAYAAVGVEIRLILVPYARCKAYVMTGLVAGCFNMSPAPEQAGKVKLADVPLFRVWPRYYENPKHPVDARSEAQVRPGTRVGIVNGYEYPDSLHAMETRGVILDRANTEAGNLKKLEAGRIDLAVIMVDQIKTGERMLHDAQVGHLAVAFEAHPMGSYIGFSQMHPNGEHARELFNRGYRIISANGKKKEIMRRWNIGRE